MFAPDGSLLQTTYLAGSGRGVALVATGSNSTVFVVDSVAATFALTQSGPFPPGGNSGAAFLMRLSPNANAQTSVDGTLIKAWASHKSFQRKDRPAPPPADDPRNPTVDFHGEKRSNQTHESTTDPDARLARKSGGHEAKLGDD